MKTKKLSKVLALLMCLVLILSLCACAKNSSKATIDQTEPAVATEAVDPLWKSATHLEDVTLGEGKTTIEVEVEAGEKAITVTIKTDAKTLEDALTSVDLVQGERSEYGLFIKTVNGILADYDVDNSYWAINKDGEYMMQGANETKIKSGDKFELVYTK